MRLRTGATNNPNSLSSSSLCLVAPPLVSPSGFCRAMKWSNPHTQSKAPSAFCSFPLPSTPAHVQGMVSSYENDAHMARPVRPSPVSMNSFYIAVITRYHKEGLTQMFIVSHFCHLEEWKQWARGGPLLSLSKAAFHLGCQGWTHFQSNPGSW
jgi:hypothetical protein